MGGAWRCGERKPSSGGWERRGLGSCGEILYGAPRLCVISLFMASARAPPGVLMEAEADNCSWLAAWISRLADWVGPRFSCVSRGAERVRGVPGYSHSVVKQYASSCNSI